MQLKLKRSQRDGGMLGGTVIFCLDARAEYTAEEKRNIERYKLSSQAIYNSEASKRLLNKAASHDDGSTRGALKAIGVSLLAGMRLNISIGSLERGHHIECKTIDELLGAEEQLMEACEGLRNYLNAAASFDGREVVVDFSSGKPAVVAESQPSAAMLMPPSPEPLRLEGSATAIEYEAGYASSDPSSRFDPVAQWNRWWNDPDKRKVILIVGGILLGLLLLKACH